ncbi:MAG: hypothetical protein RDU20_23300 [Desulfomonilaceae bacterium]|nr:hypothetical protein [Desulfomonilaceae bacterium]
MITREQLRAELDEVEDKDLEIVHRIITALASSPCSSEPVTKPLHETPEWHRFIEDMYGCLSDDPIERGDQGRFELREAVE